MGAQLEGADPTPNTPHFAPPSTEDNAPERMTPLRKSQSGNCNLKRQQAIALSFECHLNAIGIELLSNVLQSSANDDSIDTHDGLVHAQFGGGGRNIMRIRFTSGICINSHITLLETQSIIDTGVRWILTCVLYCGGRAHAWCSQGRRQHCCRGLCVCKFFRGGPPGET